MIGVIAGDIIASTFKSFPTEDTTERYFPLFASRTRFEMTGEGRARRVRSWEYEPKRSLVSDIALAAGTFVRSRDKGSEAFFDSLDGSPSFLEMLAGFCGTIVQSTASEQAALAMVRNVFSYRPEWAVSEPLMEAYVKTLYMAKRKAAPEEMARVLTEAGLDVQRNCSEMRPFVTGFVTVNDRGRIVPGDGVFSSSPYEILPAAFAAFREGDSYEDAVRRAAVVGGNAPLIAALTGAYAELRWGVPPKISDKVKVDYLSDGERVTFGLYEKFLTAKPDDLADEEGVQISVINMEGMSPVYLVPDTGTEALVRQEILDAIQVMQSRRGATYEVVSTAAEFNERYALYSRQTDAEGNVLTGTYVERPRPEIRHIWFQDHELRSAVSRKGLAYFRKEGERQELISPKARVKIFRDWQKLREYIQKVRGEIDALVLSPDELAGLAPGQHVHPGVGMYPVENGMTGAIYEGEVERLRFGINDDGRFFVDNLAEGGFHGEGIQGILDTMNLTSENANMKEVRTAIDYYCLDVGKEVYTEEELRILEQGDEGEVYSRVEGIKALHASNVKKIEDATKVGEVPFAVMPVMGRKTMDEEAAQEERTQESRQALAGARSLWSIDNRRAYVGSMFTIGFGNMSLERFNQLMKDYGIEVVVDMRSVPYSKFKKEFNSDNLEKNVSEVLDAEYYHVPAFGSEQETSRKDRFLSFDETVNTPKFKEQIAIIRKMASKNVRTAFVTADKDVLLSPRALLVGRMLQSPATFGSKAKPVDVYHIEAGGKCVSQKEVEALLLNRYGLQEGTRNEPSINVFYGAEQHPELSNFAHRPFTAVVLKNSARGQIEAGMLTFKDVTALLSGGFRAVSDAESRTGIAASWLEAVKFRCVEQFYQYCKGFYVAATRSPGGELTTASKTRLRAVQEACRKIMGTEDPAVCKFVGGQIEGLDKQVWDKARKEVMHAGVKLSFDPRVNPSAWESLDRTGNILITHVQAEPQTAEIFTSVLTDVRSEWRKEGYGKKYDRSELVKPDTVLRTENSRLMAAYAGAERSMRSGEKGINLIRNMYKRNYERENRQNTRKGRGRK